MGIRGFLAGDLLTNRETSARFHDGAAEARSLMPYAVLDAMQARLDRNPDRMRVRRQTVEHPFGTIKSWMGPTHFQMKALKNVSTEMAHHVLAYKINGAMSILGVGGLIEAIRA
jgi:hypothetical protein